MKEYQYVLVIDTMYGTDIYLFNNPNFADDSLENYVFANWSREFPNLSYKDFEDPVQHYFDNSSSEFAVIEPVIALDEPEVFDVQEI